MYTSLKAFVICYLPSFILMLIFVIVNLPYYKKVYGDKLSSNLIRTIVLNATAMVIGWVPVIFLWRDISVKFLLPLSCIFGAIAVVGSRFIYHDIIPDNLVKAIISEIERQNKQKNNMDK